MKKIPSISLLETVIHLQLQIFYSGISLTQNSRDTIVISNRLIRCPSFWISSYRDMRYGEKIGLSRSSCIKYQFQGSRGETLSFNLPRGLFYTHLFRVIQGPKKNSFEFTGFSIYSGVSEILLYAVLWKATIFVARDRRSCFWCLLR